MREADLLSIIAEGAARFAQLSQEEQNLAIADLRQASRRVALGSGLSAEEGERLANDLIAALQACAPNRVLH